jgi:hypothetical protein
MQALINCGLKFVIHIQYAGIMLPLPSLKSRVISSATSASSPPVTNDSEPPNCNRPPEYKVWSMDAMSEAIEEVQKGMSVRKAAECYSVPRSTLRDYLSGRSNPSSRSGAPLLTEDEETELATFLIEVAKIGYPHTRKQVLSKVQAIIEAKGMNHKVTYGWWESFRKRHKHCLTLKSAVPLSMARAKATDVEVIERYFCMLEECMRHYDIMDKPSRMYNCDETGLPLNPPCHKVVSQVGSKNPPRVNGNSKQQITVLACTSATGTALPPMIVMKKRPITEQLAAGEVPGTMYAFSDTGWMNRELFSEWFKKHFLQYAHKDRPIILLMDGHASHFDPSTIAMAAEASCILCALPPNTTHLLQPLDMTQILLFTLENSMEGILPQLPGQKSSQSSYDDRFQQSVRRSMV